MKRMSFAGLVLAGISALLIGAAPAAEVSELKVARQFGISFLMLREWWTIWMRKELHSH